MILGGKRNPSKSNSHSNSMVIGTLYSCNVTLGEIMFPVYIEAGFVCACPCAQTCKLLPAHSKPVFTFSAFCCCLVAQLCPNSFTTPWNVSHQAPFVHGILQARLLEWVAIPFSRGSSLPRDRTHISCIDRWIIYP